MGNTPEVIFHKGYQPISKLHGGYPKMKLTREQRIRQKLYWFHEARQLGNVKLVCRRMGISRKTYYKWWQIYKASGFNPQCLADRSRRPHNHPRTIRGEWKDRIVRFREDTGYGPARLWAWLVRQGFEQIPSPFGIYKVLSRQGLTRSRSKPTRKKHKRRYEMPMPGDRIQIDIKFVPYRIRGAQSYQYTAIDDCSRYRVAEIYPERCNSNSKDFLLKVIQRMPFPVRCVQTDNDSTFTNWYTGAPKTAPHKPVKIHAFTRTCHEHDIEHVLIKPGQPQLNGKVERSHQCDEEEFYRTFKAQDFHELQQRFGQWLDFYNHHRPHSSLGYLTPVERLAKRLKLDSENWIWSEPNPTSPSAKAQCLSSAAQGRLAQRARSWTLDKQTEQRLSRYAPSCSVTHV